MKTECRSSMLLRDMNILKLMTHDQQVEGDKLRKQAKENKRLGLGTMTTLSRNLVVKIARRVRKSFQPHSRTMITSIPSSKNMYDQKVRAPESKS